MVGHINRRNFIALSGAAGVAGLAGCLGGDGDESNLSWHAGGQGGTYYPLSSDFKTIVDGETEYTLQVQSTGASLENVGNLFREEADFALIQNDVAHFAYTGVGIDELGDEEMTNLRGVASLYPETIHVITQAGSGIETVEDLEGQTVVTGAPGSGTQLNALQILETAGIEEDDFDEQNADFDTAADQIQDGDADAAFVVAGWPAGSVENLATNTDISLVEIAGDTREDVMDDAEWFAEDTVPADTYDGVESDVETVSVQAMIATHEGVDEAVVEAVTEAIFENLDDVSQKEEFIDVDSAQDGMPIDLHPGAEAYLD
ncbi:TAXI family TRAP transporter solute-binding subunit [Natronolimnohabitans sp. A-GB9]|uniref:TAXI family TRAP transporter solute-binding subunit n=1 Tax=Natronolimnohabitans sp. A-GB9 TaxID=3069757 RepID=UPI0027B43DD1|nr:TAXI family TRAP transporter solute-binding subunit [Natronolimnohabitans sp. A-GB9]MDQ2051849.1 TAXI family TRAP transporter solute-binding subunit [Natronolimnohabitans sp. A-GB9]